MKILKRDERFVAKLADQIRQYQDISVQVETSKLP